MKISTKTRSEKEDQEVERLIRPSPKHKPPRRDLRRNRVEVEEDPDLDEKDKDLSQNRKDIGGSVGGTVLNRWLIISKDKRVKVKTRDTDKVVLVSPETLKLDPSKYEVIKDGPEKPKLDPNKYHDIKDQNKPEPTKPQEVKDETPKDSEPPKSDAEKKSVLQEEAKANPQLKTVMDALQNKESPLYFMAVDAKQGNPSLPISRVIPTWNHPTIKTLGDLHKIVNTVDPSAPTEATPAADGKKPKKKKAPKPADPAAAIPSNPQAPAGTPGQPAAPATNQPLQYKAPTPKPVVPEKPQQRATRNELQELITKNPELGRALKDFASPKSQAFKDAEANPWTPARDYLKDVLKGTKLPADIDNIADLQLLMKLPAKAPKPVDTETELTESDLLPAEPEDKKPAVKPVSTGRKVTKAEQHAATNQIIHTFPVEMSTQLLRLQLHPDEVSKLIEDYTKAKSLPLNNASSVNDLVEKAKKFYSLDPSKVKPPSKVVVNGKEIPFSSSNDPTQPLLPAQSKALKEHQLKTVALSLAAHDAVSNKFETNGMPKTVASTLANFMLTTPDLEHQDDKDARAHKLSEKIFYDTLSSTDDPLDEKTKIDNSKGKSRFQDEDEDKPLPRGESVKLLSGGKVKNILKTAPTPEARKIAVGYLQGQDYQEARKRFLSQGSKEQITEHADPKEIINGLKKADLFFKDRNKLYPKDSTVNDPSLLFRERVMKHLTKLSPKKAEAVRKGLDEHDNQMYDSQLSDYRKQIKHVQPKVQKVTDDYTKEYEEYSKALRSGQDPDPPLPVKDRLKHMGIDLPNKPKKPAKYDAMRKPPKDLAQDAKSMFDSHLSKLAAHSTYPGSRLMGDNKPRDKSAVYWGVDPYEDNPLWAYSGWGLPGDSSKADFERVVKLAKNWMIDQDPSWTTPENKDAQAQVALAFALREANMEGRLHPTVYDSLLAKLSGGNRLASDSTLRNEAMSSKIETTPEKINTVLARLDRIASVVQENHEKWGMKFEAAKALTNQIDKVADELELATYGEDSLLNRQASVMKIAEVLEGDADERSYMSEFESTTKPHQIDADEVDYMKLYNDDQSSCVQNGKTESGRPLVK